MACIALITVLILAALVAGIAIGMAYSEIKHLRERIAKLKAMDGKKYLPYYAADEIENGLAALNYEIFDEEVRHERFMNAIAHFKNARRGSK